ncbi:hypothetical protein B0H14DRAFT_3434270 [Mycena olivaceomarginata]|nr:hypothetical protein B0H14DRAFT_3434270 [Mycena olivaceomarginata]
MSPGSLWKPAPSPWSWTAPRHPPLPLHRPVQLGLVWRHSSKAPNATTEKNAKPKVRAQRPSLRRIGGQLWGTPSKSISNTADLAHAGPGWTGKRTTQEGHAHASGMGGKVYTRKEIQALTGSADLVYINWLGRLSIPIIDSTGRIIAVLGGMPSDMEGWQQVTDRAAQLMETQASKGSFSAEQLHHRRAQEPYPQVSHGLSHGGGQLEPGELCNNVANTKLTDGFLRDPSFQRLSGFANCLFRVFAPLLYAFYEQQMALIATWKPTLHWNFARSCLTLTLVTLRGAGALITALGSFDPDLGGHLVLWDLKLVIRFPPSATILIPSTIIRHSNVPVAPHERRYSFTQYTAGGLFRWIQNGFQMDKAFELHATAAEKAARAEEAASRWQAGVAMFSRVDDE